MNKKILAVMIIAALGLCMATGCGKKDDTRTEPTQQTAQTNGESEQNSEQNSEPAQQDAENNSGESDVAGGGETQSAEPIEMTTEEFEDLVDTFNNPQSEEEKEAARVKLEAVLKQMEQQQQ